MTDNKTKIIIAVIGLIAGWGTALISKHTVFTIFGTENSGSKTVEILKGENGTLMNGYINLKVSPEYKIKKNSCYFTISTPKKRQPEIRKLGDPNLGISLDEYGLASSTIYAKSIEPGVSCTFYINWQ